ncbi:MAG: helix-turn-helix domain-containing protein [Bacteroidetes bacterium]|nr:helix-turn-helix domain-containing protein [Bacteroidota bacterium]
MQKQLIQIEQIDSSILLQQFEAINKRLDVISKTAQPKEPEDYITRQDVADMFKISLPTVHAWINAGILKPYKIANKTRFLLSEVKAAAKAQCSKRERLA